MIRAVVVTTIAATAALVSACSASTPPPVAPPPVLVVDQPLPEQLATGLVGSATARRTCDRVGLRAERARRVTADRHIHVTVDDAPWHWADGSGEPLIIQGLPAGPHRVWIRLADPTHKILDSKTVDFVVPTR
ncbi:DUF6130 family protein [Amycolatopsis taiwanensis]|uniref:Uncharacterized protein n=1 Tax=Amycolatopsis taiwanensis TaxID=342230 RepID=A0A9W6R9W9_9PSEU|nr:DUF6130 family protein [Amycolatopsis taiwanensis]GLY70212.1 hypothetical protein Atai01_68310 [Amycolatopsis taiwanensis]